MATRLPLWVGPGAVLVVLVCLTLALWGAELTLEGGAGRGLSTPWTSSAALWGGLVISSATAAFLFLTMLHRVRADVRTRRHLNALESLHAISSAIIARVDAGPGALSELCEAAQRMLSMDRAGILLLDARARRLELLAFAGDMPPNPPRLYPLAELPLVTRCLNDGEVLFSDDVRWDPVPQNSRVLEFFRARALILIPLSVRGEQIGLMTLSSSRPGRVDEIGGRLAELLGAQAAVILANSRLYQGQQRAVRRYKALIDQRELLFSTNAAIYQTGDLDESLRRVAELAPLALQVDVCIVSLAAPEPNNIKIVAVTPGVAARYFKEGVATFCPNCELALTRGDAVVVEDASQNPGLQPFLDDFGGIGSVVYVPLLSRAGGERIGVLALVRRHTGAFSPDQLNMARLFSTRAAAAIENARLHQETRRALSEQKKLAAQRDALWSVNAAVYQAGTLHESLRRIVRLAPEALGGDVCAVDMVTAREGEIALAAITGEQPPADLIGRPVDVSGMNAGTALRERRVLVIEDARSDRGIPEIYRERFDMGSIAYLPLLRVDGQPLGLLILIRHAAGGFDAAEIELARVFSTRAASAIENAQLLEQTRRDADTKAMLLRELNHRVKNNLAGIVALLSIGQPEMPPAAQRWLDRVTDRVRVMAGAHQLFVGDASSVQIGTLVERMLSSLAVARPSGVEMRVDLGPRDIELRTEQAISLAMALHELCYNAIVHGLDGHRGTVTLRTRSAGAGRLAVDVIDEGRGSAPGPRGDADAASANGGSPDGGHEESNGNGTGIGLELVKGLVRRELRGVFSMARRPDGGTVATVEFPLPDTNNERETS